MANEIQTEIPVTAVNTDAIKTTGDALAAPLIAGMPEPTGSSAKDVPAGETLPSGEIIAPPPPPVNEYPHATDSEGTKFDPLLHKRNDDGTPKTNKASGKFVLLNRGRPPGSVNAPKSDTVLPTQTHIPGAVQNASFPDEYTLNAQGYVKAATGGLCVLISDEWAPESEAEEKWLVDMTANYMRAKGSIDLTPGQILALGIAAYAGGRFRKPKTQAKMKTFGETLRGWFGKKKE